MADSGDSSVHDEAGFMIPAQHARRARIRQKRLENQQDFQFRPPPAPKHKNAAAHVMFSSKQWDKGIAQRAAPAKNTEGLKPEHKQWSTFLASLQSGQSISTDHRAAEPALPEWTGSVHWNTVWDKAVSSEAEKQQGMQELVAFGSAEATEAAASAPISAPEAPRRRPSSGQGFRMLPVPMHTGLLLGGGTNTAAA